MRYTALYLIEPKPALQERLKLIDGPDLGDLLLEPIVLSHQEGGRSFWSADDLAQVVKLVFLAQIKEYDPFVADEDFQKIFGAYRLSASLFDRWWSIRRLVVDDSAEGIYPLVKRFSNLVDCEENSRITEWLEWIRAGGSSRKA